MLEPAVLRQKNEKMHGASDGNYEHPQINRAVCNYNARHIAQKPGSLRCRKLPGFYRVETNITADVEKGYMSFDRCRVPFLIS